MTKKQSATQEKLGEPVPVIEMIRRVFGSHAASLLTLLGDISLHADSEKQEFAVERLKEYTESCEKNAVPPEVVISVLVANVSALTMLVEQYGMEIVFGAATGSIPPELSKKLQESMTQARRDHDTYEKQREQKKRTTKRTGKGVAK